MESKTPFQEDNSDKDGLHEQLCSSSLDKIFRSFLLFLCVHIEPESLTESYIHLAFEVKIPFFHIVYPYIYVT